MAAKGKPDDNSVLYISLQLRQHFHMTKEEVEGLSDEDWAEHYAILQHILTEQAKHNQPFTS
jgi:hypothetical protein